MKNILLTMVTLAGIIILSSCNKNPAGIVDSFENQDIDLALFKSNLAEMEDLASSDLSFAQYYAEMVSIDGMMTGDYSHMPVFAEMDTIEITGIVTSVDEYGNFVLMVDDNSVFNVDIQHGPMWAINETPDYKISVDMTLTVKGILMEVIHDDDTDQTWLKALQFIYSDGTVVDVQNYRGGTPPWGGDHFGHGNMNGSIHSPDNRMDEHDDDHDRNGNGMGRMHGNSGNQHGNNG